MGNEVVGALTFGATAGHHPEYGLGFFGCHAAQ
jgi:hypothetical protein